MNPVATCTHCGPIFFSDGVLHFKGLILRILNIDSFKTYQGQYDYKLWNVNLQIMRFFCPSFRLELFTKLNDYIT